MNRANRPERLNPARPEEPRDHASNTGSAADGYVVIARRPRAAYAPDEPLPVADADRVEDFERQFMAGPPNPFDD